MWPHYDLDDINIVSDILKSGKVNYWTGNNCIEFEKEFSRIFECKYLIALANGSLALSAAYIAAGLKEGDETITTPRTFIATSSTAVLLGIKPIFADVDLNSGAITNNSIEKLITKKQRQFQLFMLEVGLQRWIKLKILQMHII